MKRLILAIPLHIFMLFSIKYSYSQAHINPEARKLNDSAYRVWRDFPFPTQKLHKFKDGKLVEVPLDTTKDKYFTTDSAAVYKRLMSLLDQALKIDSNYWVAYWSKFSYQSQWKKHVEAVKTGEKLLKFFPNESMIKLAVAEQYDDIGDTTVAKKYYNEVLTVFNKALDTMSINNRNRSLIEWQKADVLILLHQSENVQSFLKKLYDKETDDLNKRTIKAMMNRTRAEILSGKGFGITY
jgi:tetratricopeptide (TPR) repeat protein